MCKVFFIEACDYAGKTTLIKNIKKKFKNKKILTLREPEDNFRELLLNVNNGFIHSQTRRFLFAASHTQIMSDIYENKDKYDYILVDRTSIISDLVYSILDPTNNNLTDYVDKVFKNIFNVYKYADENYFNGFFKKNSNLVFLKIDNKTFKERLQSRVVNKNDIIDSKDDSFKWTVKSYYDDLIRRKDGLFTDMFNDIYVIQALDAEKTFYQFYEILCKGANNV